MLPASISTSISASEIGALTGCAARAREAGVGGAAHRPTQLQHSLHRSVPRQTCTERRRYGVDSGAVVEASEEQRGATSARMILGVRVTYRAVTAALAIRPIADASAGRKR